MITIGLYSEDCTFHPLLSSALGRDFRVLLESDGDGMDELVSAGDCDVLILDLNSNHDSLQKRIGCVQRLIASNVPSIIMADDSLRSTAFELVRSGAFAYCRRPPSIRDLKTMLQRACETTSLKRQLHTVQQHEMPGCDRLIGTSPQMERVYQLVRSVTNLNAAVLVTGESGTGKELIARAIHNLGSRANKPFVAVSCGAIPETLIEAELFGHEKGAFTGTVGAREGYFEQAADGTLFLDEIGDLSLFTQVKLLRVLQQMEFSRLGSNRLVPLRARLIFATHQDLGKLVAEGKFRQDLYYRINSNEHCVPPAAGSRGRHHAHRAPLHCTKYSGNLPEADAGHRTRRAGDAAGLLVAGQCARVRKHHAESHYPGSRTDSSRGRPEFESSGAGRGNPSVRGRGRHCRLPARQGSFERMLQDYKVKIAMNAVKENNGNKTLAARSLLVSHGPTCTGSFVLPSRNRSSSQLQSARPEPPEFHDWRLKTLLVWIWLHKHVL